MTILLATGAVIGVVMAIYYLRAKKPVATAFKGMFSGGLALVIASYLGAYLNISLALSFFNTIIALALGVPGVILMVVGKLILV